MSSFKFLFFWVAFCFAKNRLFRVPYALRATSIALQRFETGLVSSSIFCHDLKTKHLELNLLDTNQNLLKPFKIHLQYKIHNKKKL